MRLRLAAIAGLLVALCAASPARASGRAAVNPAWLETLDLANWVRHAPQATIAELAELERRMVPLGAEQRRLIAEARVLDQEEAWLLRETAWIDGRKVEFANACSQITDEATLNACQGLVDTTNAAVRAYNARYHAFTPREARYTQDVKGWLGSLESAREWMRPILSRREFTAAEKVLLAKERDRLRAEVDGLQEALRRLDAGHASGEGERGDWERRYEQATARAKERLRDYLADQASEQAEGVLEACSERLTKRIRWKVDERINVQGGSAANRAELVKALDAEMWDPLESTCRHASLSIL